MVSLQYLSVIQGKPTMSAEAMAARIRQLGHSLVAVEWTDTVCTLKGTHAHTGDSETVSFTMDDAKRANLTGDNWRKYPKAMLRARATTMIARALFADAIMGISYTPDELGAAVEVEAEVVREELAPMPERYVPPKLAEPKPKPRRRKAGPVDQRCTDCDGYGGDEAGVECDGCRGAGQREKQASHFEPAGAPASAEDVAALGAALGVTAAGPAAGDDGAYVWHALQDRELPHASLSAGYDPEAAENAAELPLSFDVCGYLCTAMVSAGRANDLSEAVGKLREVTEGNPTANNGWAIGLADRMTKAAVTA